MVHGFFWQIGTLRVTTKRWLLDIVWGITLKEYKMNQHLASVQKSMLQPDLWTGDGKMLVISKQIRK